VLIEELTRSVDEVDQVEVAHVVVDRSARTNKSNTQSLSTSHQHAAILKETILMYDDPTISSNRWSTSSQIMEQMTAIAGQQDMAASELATSQQSILEALDVLQESLKGIQKISGFIIEVAEQSNLLGLNAAIEAARAGESGRGFSVVAEEIRKLAQKSRDAVKQITDSITSINTQSQTVESQIQKTKTISQSLTATSNQLNSLVDTLQQGAEQSITESDERHLHAVV
jgi:methyl-accepting chemotaxis protein